MKVLTMHEKFEPLFKPNRPPEEMAKYRRYRPYLGKRQFRVATYYSKKDRAKYKR